jgi:hypothetical protein
MGVVTKQKVGSSRVIEITLASLANAALRQSDVVRDIPDAFLDALVQVKVKTGTPVAGDKALNVYAYAGMRGGVSPYSGTAVGANAPYYAAVGNCDLLGTITCPTDACNYTSRPMSIAKAFNGRMPEAWGIIIENKTGVALDAHADAHAVTWIGV